MKPGDRYYPKTTEQKLGYLVEECGEVLAAAGKTQRWGFSSVNPELPPEQQETNRDWLLRELQDLKGAIALIETMLLSPPDVSSAVLPPAPPPLTFSQRNRKRCESALGFNHQLGSWTLSDWLTATVGEIGEAANIIKKLNRYRDGIPGNKLSERELKERLAEELGDTAVYLDLICQAAGLDFDTVREAAFQRKSAEIGYKE